MSNFCTVFICSSKEKLLNKRILCKKIQNDQSDDRPLRFQNRPLLCRITQASQIHTYQPRALNRPNFFFHALNNANASDWRCHAKKTAILHFSRN